MKFKVQAWVQLRGYSKRIPMEAREISASDGINAAIRYTTDLGIPRGAWWNAGPSPQVVIRTEETP